jgi:orotidine-5'-phosphate decarboxylase
VTPESLAPPRFGDRLCETFESRGQLCVGIDPHEYLLDSWGLEASAVGVREFGLRVVEAAAGVVGIVKPQVAFFELFGSAGYRALEDVLAAAREAGLIIIADAKRGDIGTSVEAYGRAWLTPGHPLESDAVTLAPYMGTGSLASVFTLAEAHGKGAFVLVATSNAEAQGVQTARVNAGTPSAQTVAGLISAEVTEWNSGNISAIRGGSSGFLGNIGVVLGATRNLQEFGLDPKTLAAVPSLPILAPGFGHQGAVFADVKKVYGDLTASTVVSVSRSVLGAGPDGIHESIRRQAGELREALA